MDHSYDLRSGNVNEVHYQNGQWDEFHHRRSYDADNRLQDVFTSRDGMQWERDARQFCTALGSLARTELGRKQVQGIDHTYTLHGWLRSVNAVSLDGRRSRDYPSGWAAWHSANSRAPGSSGAARYSRAWVRGGLAKQIGIMGVVLGRYERDEVKPSIEVAAKIAQALGVSLDYLVGNSEVLLDKDLIKRITEIQQLSEADRQGVFFALDGLLRDAKERKAYA